MREAQLDDLLRREKFVDLYKVVRHAIRTTEQGLSIKDLEIFYMPPREGEVDHGGGSIVHYERWRVTQDDAELERIRAYNEDDCRSTHLLRDWLLTLRPAGLPWFVPDVRRDDAAGIARTERTRKIEAALARHHRALLGGLPDDRSTWTEDQHLRGLVFDLLDFHRRAAKPGYWAMFARQDMTVEELIDDAECLGGLTRIADALPVALKQSFVYTFAFPEQDTKLRVGKQCQRTDTTDRLGEIVALDEEARTIGIKVSKNLTVPAALSIGPERPLGTDPLRNAIERFADSIEAGDGRFAAVRALLRKDPPILRGRPQGAPVFVERRRSLRRGIVGGARARRQLSVRAGTAGKRQDDDRLAPDRGAAEGGQARRRHVQQPQGDHQPAAGGRERCAVECGYDVFGRQEIHEGRSGKPDRWPVRSRRFRKCATSSDRRVR